MISQSVNPTTQLIDLAVKVASEKPVLPIGAYVHVALNQSAAKVLIASRDAIVTSDGKYLDRKSVV